MMFFEPLCHGWSISWVCVVHCTAYAGASACGAHWQGLLSRPTGRHSKSSDMDPTEYSNRNLPARLLQRVNQHLLVKLQRCRSTHSRSKPCFHSTQKREPCVHRQRRIHRNGMLHLPQIATQLSRAAA